MIQIHQSHSLCYFISMRTAKKRLCFLLLLFLCNIATIAGQTKDSIRTVTINAIGGLQFDLIRFKVKPGERVKIVLTNNDDMTHNLVFTSPGAREEVANAALQLGDKGIEMNYIPKSSNVLWSIKLLLPGESRSISFIAPKNEGVYPYVCTYPGHGSVMFGAMYVTKKELPELKDDSNVPERNRKEDVTKHGSKHTKTSAPVSKRNHPYTQVPPYLYRIFMPDASPAAIAVRLPQSLSYCWDAGTCRLRYAWEGEFLDNTAIWKGHKDAYAKILGTVFFHDKTAFPLQINTPGSIPVVKFKGYRLIDRYPEFHYLIDGIDVYELIRSKSDGSGLIRTFRIPQSDKQIWFVVNSGDGVTYRSDAGKWVNGKLKLTADQARTFTITMTKSKL